MLVCGGGRLWVNSGMPILLCPPPHPRQKISCFLKKKKNFCQKKVTFSPNYPNYALPPFTHHFSPSVYQIICTFCSFLLPSSPKGKGPRWLLMLSPHFVEIRRRGKPREPCHNFCPNTIPLFFGTKKNPGLKRGSPFVLCLWRCFTKLTWKGKTRKGRRKGIITISHSPLPSLIIDAHRISLAAVFETNAWTFLKAWFSRVSLWCVFYDISHDSAKQSSQ